MNSVCNLWQNYNNQTELRLYYYNFEPYNIKNLEIIMPSRDNNLTNTIIKKKLDIQYIITSREKLILLIKL